MSEKEFCCDQMSYYSGRDSGMKLFNRDEEGNTVIYLEDNHRQGYWITLPFCPFCTAPLTEEAKNG